MKNKIKTIVVEGTEYLNTTNAAKMAKVCEPTFRKKVEIHHIPKVNLPGCKKIHYRKTDIKDAIKSGFFQSMR